MARYTGPKDRLSRAENFDLYGKGAKLTRLMIPPGIHGARRYGRVSQYKRQLREKQKVKRIYGVLEKQFKKYVTQAFAAKGNTGDKLLSLLERRLDNVVFRLGFAPTRPAARQLVSHKQILVNGKKLNIPSYQVELGDTISMSGIAMEIPAVKKLLQQEDFKTPGWLKRKAAAGKVAKIPGADDVAEPISTQDIIEFYSR